MSSELSGTVSTALRIHMAKWGFNIKDLSERTGLSRTTISNLSNEKTDGVNFDTLEKLSAALNCKVSDLFRTYFER